MFFQIWTDHFFLADIYFSIGFIKATKGLAIMNYRFNDRPPFIC